MNKNKIFKSFSVALAASVLSSSFIGAVNVSAGEMPKNFALFGGADWFWPEDENNTYIRANCETIRIAENGYDALKDVLEIYNQRVRDNSKSFVEDNQAEALEYMPSFGGDAYYSYSTQVIPYRADEKVLSFGEGLSSYMGGAHGSYFLWGYTYDAVTGEEIPLKSIITDYDRLYQIVLEKLETKYGSVNALFEGYETTLREQFDREYFSWVMNMGGISLFYNQYELAPYAAGLLQIDIDYDEYPDLFTGDYFYSGNAGVYQLDAYMFEPLVKDFNHDQIPDTIEITNMHDYEAFETDLTVRYNGAETTEHVWGSIDAFYLVTTEDQRVYLYAQNISENDYHSIYVFDLNGSTPVLAGCQDDCGVDIQAFAYPDCMFFTSKIDILGTYGGHRSYHVGANGLPEANEAEYQLNTNSGENRRSLTSSLDMKVWLCDEAGNETGEAYYPAGTVFYPYATDEATYVQAVLENGEHCRIHVEQGAEYGYAIDGVSEWECFEFLPYAG